MRNEKRDEMILVTNYSLGLANVPIKNVMPDKRVYFNKKQMELTINESLSVGVFEVLPQLRDDTNNKVWFERNLYHLKPSIFFS